MNFDEFVKTYKGKKVEYDKVSYYQCVDLVKMYVDKVLNLHFGAYGNAKDYYYSYKIIPTLCNNFTKIANTPTFIPQKGDIVVWNNGKNGHIAIATGEGTTRWVNSFDQNYGLNKRCRIVKHDYKNFLGVLRPDNQLAIYGSKYNAGEDVEIRVPIGIAYTLGNDCLVDDGTQQFWVDKSVIQDNKIVARVKICYASHTRYIVQLFDKQFWVDEKNIVKKL